MSDFKALEIEFNSILRINWKVPSEYQKESEKLIHSIGADKLLPMKYRKAKLIQAICKKHELNKEVINNFIDYSAGNKIFYNYHQKVELADFYNSQDLKGFLQFATENGLKDECIKSFFIPLSSEQTLKYLQTEILDTQKSEEILLSLFASYISHCFPAEFIHSYFNPDLTVKRDYNPKYYSFLRENYSEVFNRELGLSVLKLDQTLFDSFNSTDSFYNALYATISKTYFSLSNHCYFAVIIDPIKDTQQKKIEWDIYANLVLFSEKFIEEQLKVGYFHPDKIAEETKKYISGIGDEAQFDVANGGFSYKDCLIISNEDINQKKSKFYSEYALIVLFEKSQRDERIIPCPSCRSKNVRGNSYPILGVKSWECNNILCQGKSKYNRGKRYALASIIKQEAIDNPANYISEKTINAFRLDVASAKNIEEVLEFIICHYSLFNDKIEFINIDVKKQKLHGRLISQGIICQLEESSRLSDFFDSAFFKRFRLSNVSKSVEIYDNLSNIENCQVYNGDSFFVLQQFEEQSIHGAVTSPPYYNARTYSQWPNIYCYLYDMLNNAKEVFRVLKPGAPYLYNIFDYFDNERSIVFSAMGKKRMILGAYIIHLFKSIGFEIVDNIIWYKGHIQGNRSNNQGNKSPYYQAPLNCYEHIFYFRKPGDEIPLIEYPKVLKAHPVVKIIKGKNILGHTAPFPSQIPELLTRQLGQGATILDPYSGSFTTARKAVSDHQGSISIELDPHYCELGMNLLAKDTSPNQIFLLNN